MNLKEELNKIIEVTSKKFKVKKNILGSGVNLVNDTWHVEVYILCNLDELDDLDNESQKSNLEYEVLDSAVSKELETALKLLQ